MTRQLKSVSAVAILIALLSTPLHAQLVVFDPANYVEAISEVVQLIKEVQWMLRQAQRLPVDMANRYRVVSPTWSLYDLANGLRFAQPILNALNNGDPNGTGYRQITNPLDIPDDILGRMPAAFRSRLQTAYATIELADRVAAMGVNQAGTVRVNGNSLLQVVQSMQNDAVASSDDYHTQTALLNKINGAAVLSLREGEQANQFLADAIEQLIVDNTRKRATEAAVMNATITQWRYGQAYGQDLFRNTAAELDSWRLR
jgi:hypothetical protein